MYFLQVPGNITEQHQVEKVIFYLIPTIGKWSVGDLKFQGDEQFLCEWPMKVPYPMFDPMSNPMAP